MATTFTPDEIQADLAMWRDAYRKVASGQAYEINGRRLTRANLPEIRKQIIELRRELQQATGGSVLGTNVGLPGRSYR